MTIEHNVSDQSDFLGMLQQYQSAVIKRDKIVTAEEAVRVVRNGDTVVFGGFVGVGAAEEVAAALEAYYLRTGKPKDLTLMFTVATGLGDDSARGLNHLAHEGLLRRIIGGHWGMAPKIQRLAVENRVIAYNLPQGIISHMYRNVASGKAGIFSKVGLGTFVDPRNGGGRLNLQTTEEIVHLMSIAGEEYLFYDALPINVAVVRGTHGGHGWQHHHGKGGPDAGVALHCHGGQEFRRVGHRSGGAGGTGRHAQPQAGQDPRYPGGLRGGGASRKPLADFQRTL